MVKLLLCRIAPGQRWRPYLVVAVTIYATVVLADGQEGVSLQEKPPSAGEIVMMIRRAREPQVIEAWRRALREGGPRERAAVARVAHVCRVASLARDLATSLQKETEYWPALEEAAARASMTGADQDKDLLEAGERLGDRGLAQIALMLARSRRAEAIPAYFDEVRSALDAESSLTEFFRLATLKDGSALGPAAAAALEAGDAGLWLALLDVSVKSDALLEANLLDSALRNPAAKISGETAWQQAMVFAGKPPSRRTEQLSNLDAVSGERSAATSDVDLAMGIELLARVLGREPIENKAWIAYLNGSSESRIDGYETMRTLTQYLTAGERKVLKKHLARLFPSLKLPDAPRAARGITKVPMGSEKRQPVVRMANGFPQGFVSDAVATSGCSLEAGPVLGQAEVSYDDLGRPVKISLLRTPPSPKCVEAITALFASTLKPIDDFSSSETPQTLLLVLEKGYLSRLEQAAVPDPDALYIKSDISEATRVEPPKRVHFVKPVYPATGQAGRKVGKVIVEVVVSREGLISDVHLLKQTEQDFIAPTFASVAQWRYRPATRGGQPVRVYLTVIVEFSLK